MSKTKKEEFEEAKIWLANFAVKTLKESGMEQGKFYSDDEVYDMLYKYFKKEYPEKTDNELEFEVTDILNFLNDANELGLTEFGYKII